MSKLAIHGGKPVRTKPFPIYNTIGDEEKKAVMEVMDTGRLSDYLGRHSEFFGGGRKVKELEALVQKKFNVKHAVSMNSATSCLYAAIGALGLGSGDEVVVSPYSMCISSTAPFLYMSIPIFADLEHDYFCLDPESIKKKISKKTKAIICVDTFGQSSDMNAIRKIADEHGLKIICDSAHALGALYNGKSAGTLADIGVYSLNAHKVIQCGEGGIAVTNDDELALRLKLIRNHAEAVIGDLPQKVDLTNMLGQNYRMPEIEAAISIEQFKKLDNLNNKRIELSEYLSKRLNTIDGLKAPAVRKDCTHVYYIYPIKYQQNRKGVARDKILEAITAEGVPLYRFSAGYMRPMWHEPIFRQKKVFARGYPFTLSDCSGKPDYGSEGCPVIERLYREEMIAFTLNYPPLTIDDMNDIANVFEKVLSNLDELKTI
jgi:dTDP-4-amino-4,6-dideoxygalactose transaminase